MSEQLNKEPIIVPDCLKDDKDCYRLFSSLIRKVNELGATQDSQGKLLGEIHGALLGTEWNIEAGLIQQVKKHERRIKVLEVVYIGGSAVLIVGGVILGMLDKITLTL